MIEEQQDAEWENAKTLEEIIRQAVRMGKGKEVKALFQVLPSDLQAKYKAIWNDELRKKKEGK